MINQNYKPIGKIVLMKKIINTMDKRYGNIVLPHDYNKNASMGVAQIIDLGSEAKQYSNLSKGDFVLYDYYAVFDNNYQYVLINVQNLLLKINKDQVQNYTKNYVISKL